MSRLSKALLGSVAVILIYFLARMNVMLFSLEGWSTRLPLWDPAAHVLDGIQFAYAFKHFSPYEFLVQLNNSGMWPPVIPLLQAPFQMIFGESWLVGRAWTAWMALPAVLMVLATGYVAHRRFGLLVGTIAATLLAISPHFQEYCLQEMFEVPGIFFCGVTLFFYISYLGSQNIKMWRWTCISGIVLFFCKFNYAVIVMLPIVFCEFTYRPDFRLMIGRTLFRIVRDIRWRSGFTRFVILSILFLVYIEKVGLDFTVAGQHVVAHRALGNPTYILFAIILIRNWIVNRNLIKSYARNIWSAPEPFRSLLRFDILPAMVWMSYPSFFKTFFIFMFSEKTRKNSFWSMETLTFYPGGFVEKYTPHPIIGVVCIISLLAMIVMWRRLPRISKFLVGLTTFNLALTILHPNYQIRYLMTSVPMLFLVTALALSHLWEFVTQRSGGRLDKFVIWTAPIIAAAFLLLFPPSRSYLQASLIANTQKEAVGDAFTAICRESSTGENNTVIGFSNFMAPSSIALRCYEAFPSMQRSQMPVTVGRLGFKQGWTGAQIVDSGKIDRFFYVDYSQVGFDVGRLQEWELLEQMKAALPGPGYEEKEIINQGPGGYRVLVYRKLPKPEAPAAH